MQQPRHVRHELSTGREEGVVITKHGQPIAPVAPVRQRRKGVRVTLPLHKGKGRPGPRCPSTETPYDLVTFDKGLGATALFRQLPVALLEPFDRTATAAPSAKPKRRGRRSTT